MLRLSVVSTLVLSALVLTGCTESTEVVVIDGSDEHHDHDHGHDHGEATARLVITQHEIDYAHVLDLADEMIIDHFHLPAAGARIYPNPNNRYALALNRNENVVSFIDGGVWVEDHGDHDHGYEEDPALLSFTLNGELPTHYDHYANRGAIFFDGVAGVPARVDVISDHSIEESRIVASLELTRNMRGAAEVRGNYLFTTYRSEDAPNTLPDFVELYERHGDHFDFVERYSVSCPSLHGSAISSHHVMFGYADGVLEIEEHGDHFDAFKIDNLEGLEGRVGTILSNESSEVFVGRAGQELYRIHADDHDHDHNEMEWLDWREESDHEQNILAMTFNHSGNRLAVLDSSGHLMIIRFRDDSYEIQSRLHVLDDLNDLGATMIGSSASHDAYITDRVNNRIIIVDLHDGVIEDTIALDFIPKNLTWLGY